MVLNGFVYYESWYSLLRYLTLPSHSFYTKSSWSKIDVFMLNELKSTSCGRFHVFKVLELLCVHKRTESFRQNLTA